MPSVRLLLHLFQYSMQVKCLLVAQKAQCLVYAGSYFIPFFSNTRRLSCFIFVGFLCFAMMLLPEMGDIVNVSVDNCIDSQTWAVLLLKIHFIIILLWQRLFFA